MCHQIAERSLHFEGRPLPLCARCLGTFLGMALALLGLWALGQGKRRRLPPSAVLAAMGGLVAFWALDGVNSLTELVLGVAPLYRPTNALRLLSGLGNGLALGALLYPLFQHAAWLRPCERRVLDSWPPRLALLAAAGIVLGLLVAWPEAPWALWAGVGAAAVLLAIGTVNATLAMLLWRKEGFAEHWRHVAPYVALGLLAAIVEMAGLALVRRLLAG